MTVVRILPTRAAGCRSALGGASMCRHAPTQHGWRDSMAVFHEVINKWICNYSLDCGLSRGVGKASCPSPTPRKFLFVSTIYGEIGNQTKKWTVPLDRVASFSRTPLAGLGALQHAGRRRHQLATSALRAVGGQRDRAARAFSLCLQRSMMRSEYLHGDIFTHT